MVDVRQAIHFEQAEKMNTEELRKHFLADSLFAPGEVRSVYTHYDRMVLIGISPTDAPLVLGADLAKAAGADDFLDRRELAVINIGGGNATVTADGESYLLENEEALYIGKAATGVSFASADPKNPAKLYAVSAGAHTKFPNRKVTRAEASPQPMGSAETANKRTINKYIHEGLMQTCQLVVGLTRFEAGSVWNTMPAHTHDRRMEAYLYFDMPEDRLVVHLMGRPQETRHIIIRNEQAVVSPPWSIHCGSGTGAYAFVWAMAGDNQSFSDMDHIKIQDLK
ncbi:5-dehydro-4-deoxy-D-glucuronate isomerase [Lacibacterium aquatile]|uniref:4-deoxy-L-threo-5-hexosulose-uronate ketol-isomerase n=1 Tax=Lacibacterium aquatile TaxID=1168082 RepID=A0ABW5DQE5_9PROT